MRRIGVVLGVAAITAATVVLTAGAALARAEPLTINEQIPFSPEGAVNVNACTGEPIALEGTIHIVEHATFTDDGSVLVNLSHLNIQGRGVSVSGAKYVVTQGGQNVETFVVGPEPGEYTQRTHTLLVRLKVLRQGEDVTEEDFVVRSLLHLTHNANGELTAQVENFEAECR